MKLNKQQALTLVKVLTLHKGAYNSYGSSGDPQTEAEQLVTDLQDDLEDFLVYGDDDAVSPEECEDEDGVDEPDEEDDDYEDDEEEDEEDEEDEEEDLQADDTVKPLELHMLEPVKASLGSSVKFTIEFEDLGDLDSVDLLMEDDALEGVTHLKRFAKSLHVRDVDGNWTVFEVPRFSKSWTRTLPVKKLVAVGG